MAAHTEPHFGPELIDLEFVFAGEDHTGSYWNLYAINTSPYVLDYLEFKGVRRDAVTPGERVLLRRHCVETMPDNWRSAADYHIFVQVRGRRYEYRIDISEEGKTTKRMRRQETPDPTPASEALDQPRRAVYVDHADNDLIQRTVTELQTYAGTARQEGFDAVQNLALNLIGFFLERNWVGFDRIVTAEMQRRFPDKSPAEIQDGYTTALGFWTEAYFD
jgi:hypothetical protein